VRNITQLIKKLIPPNDYHSRKDFINDQIVSSLTEKEKYEVERILIQMLEKKDDKLIGETLALMKSTKSLPNLLKRLNLAKTPELKIIWASYVNQIKGGDEEMKLIALNEMDGVTEKYSLTLMFYYLSDFTDSRINAKIREFTNHKDFLIASNAKSSLGIDKPEFIKNKKSDKKWWKIWK